MPCRGKLGKILMVQPGTNRVFGQNGTLFHDDILFNLHANQPCVDAHCTSKMIPIILIVMSKVGLFFCRETVKFIITVELVNLQVRPNLYFEQ